jgi:hypothetical protein
LRAAIEQSDANGMLEIGNGLRDGRLCDPKMGRGFGHAPELRDGRQDMQVAQFDAIADAPFEVRGR